MRKLNGFSIIELLIIIAVITGLIIVAAPSFYGIFKEQFLIYNSQQLIQNIRSIQSNAFIEHAYYKLGFNSNDNSYRIWKDNNNDWQEQETSTFEPNTDIIYNNILTNDTHIMYGPNGNAYHCNKMASRVDCQSTPLTTAAIITLKTEKKDVIIEFLPINGYVSSNVGVK